MGAVVRFGMLERSKEETAAEEQRLQQAASQLRQQIQSLAQNLQVGGSARPPLATHSLQQQQKQHRRPCVWGGI